MVLAVRLRQLAEMQADPMARWLHSPPQNLHAKAAMLKCQFDRQPMPRRRSVTKVMVEQKMPLLSKLLACHHLTEYPFWPQL